MSSVFIIAEAGVNHNGNPDLAFKLVDAAVEAGVDAVKFQTFKAENLVVKSAVKADYQMKTTDSNESQFAMLKQLELTHETYIKLIDYCKEKRIEFLSTAFDLESLNFITNNLGLKTLKIPSGEITNGPLLLAHAQTGCDLIVSTGMATLGEVENSLEVIAFGLMHGLNDKTPSQEAFQEAYFSKQGQQLLQEKVTLLHCTTEYPTQTENINLSAMRTIRKAFGLKTGYSDHSEDITVPIAATALGVTIIEKHFTLDKALPGPDHKASLEPLELKKMVVAIRTVERAMGDGLKIPRPSELKNRSVVRKSLVASTVINKGDLFSEKNIVIKRPGTGKNPMLYWDIINTESRQNYAPDEVIF